MELSAGDAEESMEVEDQRTDGEMNEDEEGESESESEEEDGDRPIVHSQYLHQVFTL